MATTKSKPKPADEKKKGILISCVDARLLDETVAYMGSVGLTDKYYHLILAGCSLGLNGYSDYLKGQLGLIDKVIKMNGHNLEFVYILEHDDCGAYKLTYGPFLKENNNELKLHKIHAQTLETQLTVWLKELGINKVEIKSFIMKLNGKVEDLKAMKA